MEESSRRRVSLNPSHITIVRRPGEGSRPIFERDEILNHHRKVEEDHDLRRGSSLHSDTGRRTGINVNPPYMNYDRQSCEGNRYERRDRCPTCNRSSDCSAARQASEEYRSINREYGMRGNEFGYYELMPEESELGTYYPYGDPYYYEVWETSPFQLPVSVVYYPY